MLYQNHTSHSTTRTLRKAQVVKSWTQGLCRARKGVILISYSDPVPGVVQRAHTHPTLVVVDFAHTSLDRASL